MLDFFVVHCCVAARFWESWWPNTLSYTFCTHSKAQKTYSSMLSAPMPGTSLKSVHRELLQIAVYLPWQIYCQP